MYPPVLARCDPEPDQASWRTLTCRRCEVTWRGALVEPCWSCGAPGRPSSNTVVVTAD